MSTFAKEGGGGTPPVPLEPSKKPQTCGFLLFIRPKDKHNDTLVDDRLQLRGAKSDKNAKNARFAVGSDAKSDKNGKNARFTLGMVDDSNRPGGPVFYAGKTQKHNHGSCQIIINNGTPL